MSDETDRSARAGEYVLGLLEGRDAEAAEMEMRTDPVFRRQVEIFAARMNGLDMTAAPEVPPADMWQRISADIEGVLQDTPATAVPPHSSATTASSRNPMRPAQWMAIAASLLVGVATGYVGGWLTISEPAPVVVVVLDTPENVPGAVFEAFSDNSVRIVPLKDFVVPEGKIMQVWTLYDKSIGPVSLGTMTSSDITKLGAKPFQAPGAEQLYEITLEPFPGSPTGKPTGPILVKGFATLPGQG